MNEVRSIELKGEGVIRVQSQSPYEQLDDYTKEGLNQLKQIWSLWKKTAGVRNYLWSFFDSSPDPYKSALQVMVMSGDFHSGKLNTLAFYVMENFASWTKQQNPIPIPKVLKLDALSLVTRQKNSALIKLVVETYKMKEDKEMFVESIQQLCRSKNYKEACHIAGLLELYEHFGIEDFIVPLIFQDKYVIAEKFLQGSQKHQVELATFLDNLIGKKNIFNELQSVAMRLSIQCPKLSGLSYKPLSKLLTRIIKSFNLPSATCPNLNTKRGKGALQFLLHKRYIEKSIGGESWSEMVMEAVGDDDNLHADLVEGLTLYGDMKEALHWAERFQTPETSWPRNLLEFRRRENEESSCSKQTWEENWDDLRTTGNSFKFHKLPIPESHIKVIDTASGFSEFINNLKWVDLIGIDAEWKPSFGLKKCGLAIMQIAMLDEVYIIDVISLSSVAPQNLWERFANLFFESQNMLKVGFGMSCDLSILKETLWKLHGIQTTTAGFLDLSVLWKTLVQDFNFRFPFSNFDPSSKNSESLNTLIELCFGERLDKSDQFSNWEKRPLRRSQIIYAALDAYCLLEAYKTIVEESQKQRIFISDIIDNIVCDLANKMAKKKKGGKSHQGE